jgi:hypothetical protein
MWKGKQKRQKGQKAGLLLLLPFLPFLLPTPFAKTPDKN